MSEFGDATVLPLALWLNDAPSHKISAIIYLKKTNYIVTGSENGHIITWEFNTTEKELMPLYYLIGHKSKITNFTLAGSSRNTDLDYFISFSGDGEIGLWEASEGRSIEFIYNPQMNIQHVFSFESVNTKIRLIFCCLKNREIFVLNSISLSHICTLVCTSSPNWFSSLTAFNTLDNDDVILATTVSGLVAVWVFNFTEILNQDQGSIVIDADKYVDISTINVIKLAENPHFPEMMLVITPSQFKIFHISEWNILVYQGCHRGDYFTDGDFINHNSILMHTQWGKSIHYVLPKRSNFQSTEFMGKSTNICDDIPTILAEFREPDDMSLLRYRVFTDVNDERSIIWKAFSNGNIYRWEFLNQSSEIQPVLFNLHQSWKHMKKPQASITATLKGSPENGVVTSLLVIEDFSLIVLGMKNGLIIIKNIIDTLRNTFSECDASSNHYIVLRGHVGPVTCLLHPSSNMKLPSLITSVSNFKSNPCYNLLKLTHILWSGGRDYTIRLWNIQEEQMIHIFHCHSSPVMALKLHFLPLNYANVCGFSKGFTEAMFNTVDENEEHSYDIKQMINICMNAFLVGIAENDGLSVFSIMKQKLVLYTSEHNDPIKSLGWIIDSGYLLVETITKHVYVWDLSSGMMDRYETGVKAQTLMENCQMITKIRSRLNYDYIHGSRFVRRHTLSVFHDTDFTMSASDKLIRFQFINSGEIDRNVPVLILNLSALLDSLSTHNPSLPSLCDMLVEMKDCSMKETIPPKLDCRARTLSNLDRLLQSARLDKLNMTLKILLIKIILSQTRFMVDNTNLSPPLPHLAPMAFSFGQINSKTGCVIFPLGSIFGDVRVDPITTVEFMLIQVAITSKIISYSQSNKFVSFIDNYSPQETIIESVNSIPSWSSIDSQSILSSQYSTNTVKLFKIYRKSILNEMMPKFMKVLNGEVNYLSFNLLEKICNRLILGILDVCDNISKSAVHLLAKVISNLSDPQIQNYILLWKLFLSPHFDNNGMDDNRQFLQRIQPMLDKVIEHSYLSSDWLWWYSNDPMRTDHEKRNLSKIQVKALLNIALIGSHLRPDDMDTPEEDVHLFSKLFSLDKSFLARISCDFLMSVLSRKPKKSKSNVGRLINLSMICLSVGFLVWEPYLDSNTVICHFLKFANELEDPSVDDKFLSMVSRKAIEVIAKARPLVFIMVCYREMLRSQIAMSTPTPLSASFDKKKSLSSLSSLTDLEHSKNEKFVSLLNRNILIPIFNDLCQNKSEFVLDVLPELVELYVTFYIKEEEFSSLMLPVKKFSSVCFNELTGQISVGSVNGYIFLFDLKFGKYFNGLAHKKSIRLTQFSDDAKMLASYSVQENNIKIWQISNHLFSLGSNHHQVKMVSSQAIPSIHQMLTAINMSPPRRLQTDFLLDKVDDMYIEWEPDNKSLYLKWGEINLRHVKF